ncbi:MAG: helix-turn-helix transcriptional regulator [Treponema sp.]|nr:helix-turn-helix transcriptional regulator [Treponema sp.]
MKDIFSHFKNHSSDSPAKMGELPAALTAKSGLSPEFIKKYRLSCRQADVTHSLLLGKRDKEIAVLLNIELNTVKTHLKSVYRKTGARGRYALMALVGFVRDA